MNCSRGRARTSSSGKFDPSPLRIRWIYWIRGTGNSIMWAAAVDFEAWEARLVDGEWRCARAGCQSVGFSCFSCDQSRTKAISVRSRNSHDSSRYGPAHFECCPLLDSSLHGIAFSARKDPLLSNFAAWIGLDLDRMAELSYLSGYLFHSHCPISCSDLGLKSDRNCSSPGTAKCPSECRMETWRPHQACAYSRSSRATSGLASLVTCNSKRNQRIGCHIFNNLLPHSLEVRQSGGLDWAIRQLSVLPATDSKKECLSFHLWHQSAPV